MIPGTFIALMQHPSSRCRAAQDMDIVDTPSPQAAGYAGHRSRSGGLLRAKAVHVFAPADGHSAALPAGTVETC
jgi:hypothetical protein